MAFTCHSESKGQMVVELIMSFKKERDNVSERSRIIAVDKKQSEGLKARETS